MKVIGPHVKHNDTHLVSEYNYKYSEVEQEGDSFVCYPKEIKYTFKTEKKIPKLGLMLVGWGGNNGSTVTGGILANKHKIQWMNKRGLQKPNFYGSIT